MMEISLKQHLKNIGWDKRFLSRDGCFARITSRVFDPCFEPFSWWRRIHIRPLVLWDVFHKGMKIKFLKSLKHETLEARYFTVWLMKTYYWLIKGIEPNELLTKSVFEGYLNVDEMENHPPFSEFPWDQYLCVEWVKKSKILCRQENGKVWHISLIPLAYVTQIEVLVDESSGYSHPADDPINWIPKDIHEPVDTATRNWFTRIALVISLFPIPWFLVWIVSQFSTPGSPLEGLVVVLWLVLLISIPLAIGAFCWKLPEHIDLALGLFIHGPIIKVLFGGALLLVLFYYIIF